MKALDRLLAEGVDQHVYSHASAVVLHEGRTVFTGGNVDEHGVFDLASLTKVMSTTALCCQLSLDPAFAVSEGLGREARNGEPPNEGNAADSAVHSPSLGTIARAQRPVTVADLLFHRSGLPAFEPFFARCKTREEIIAAAFNTPLIAVPGEQMVYSDLGFIVLGELISRTFGKPLDRLFTEHVATPLGLTRSTYNPDPGTTAVVPTGSTRPREPAPGQEGLWPNQDRTEPSSPGTVDDDNAFAMGGVSGHAGLFGSARDVATFGQAVLDGRLNYARANWPIDTTPGSTRTYGFDTPSREAASCGQRFGPRAVGHLGFTGTSLWVDFGRKLVVALLTNRVVFGRTNVKIRSFRPRFHDALLDALDA